MELGTTVMIIAYIAIAAVVILAIYFQFRISGFDTRVREAESVAKGFEKVFRSVSTIEDVNKNVARLQAKTSQVIDQGNQIEDQFEVYDEQFEKLQDDYEMLKDNYNRLVIAIKGSQIESLKIDDSLLIQDRKKERIDYSNPKNRSKYEERERDREYASRKERSPHYDDEPVRSRGRVQTSQSKRRGEEEYNERYERRERQTEKRGDSRGESRSESRSQYKKKSKRDVEEDEDSETDFMV